MVIYASGIPTPYTYFPASSVVALCHETECRKTAQFGKYRAFLALRGAPHIFDRIDRTPSGRVESLPPV
jgi:hypothetical protein